MKTSDFDYRLPEGRIAAYPAKPRDASRLMVLPPEGGLCHGRFRALPNHLEAGDLLVVNDSRVIRARILGSTRGGGKAEVFLLHPEADGTWAALVKPGRKLPPGRMLHLPDPGHSLEILSDLGAGKRLVRAQGLDMEAAVRRYGHIPLPPYIARKDEAGDARRYQTIYADRGNSVAAPTAGLHFTPRVFEALAKKGVEVVRIRLDVGAGTFKPVKAEFAEDHEMEPERYEISDAAARILDGALKRGRRIVAVGTTVTRTLEDQMERFSDIRPGRYQTALYIRPGFRFRALSGLVTNFHLPRSTLLMLVSAFAGRSRILGAYEEAIRKGYRFYSFGDAMLLWRPNAD